MIIIIQISYLHRMYLPQIYVHHFIIIFSIIFSLNIFLFSEFVVIKPIAYLMLRLAGALDPHTHFAPSYI